MRRIALSLMAGCGFLAGCKQPEKSMALSQTTPVTYDTIQPDLYMADSGAPPTTNYTYEPAPTKPAQLASPETSMGYGRSTHVVTKGDTLFKLARSYYNDAAKWKDIYAANQGVLSDPNMLRVGQELVIP